VFESVTIANLTHGTPESSRGELFVSIQVNLAQSDNRKTTLRAKFDTGAQGNILPVRLYREMYPHQVDHNGKLKPNALLSSNVVLTAYGGSQIKHHGIVTIPCTYGRESTLAPFYVTNIPGPAIIGLPTSTDLNLLQFNCAIQTQHRHTSSHGCLKDKTLEQAKETTLIRDKQDLIAQYPECLMAAGSFKGSIILQSFILNDACQSASKTTSNVNMAKNGIIKKLEEGETKSWVNSVVYRRKQNGSLRPCLDPKDLNAAIQREHHVTPTLEEILPKLTGTTVFSIVDAKCGYWNVVLDKESSYLTTFNSPFGRYRFNRMSFYLKMSQYIFQTKIDQTFERCEGVAGIVDDIVVFGKN